MRSHFLARYGDAHEDAYRDQKRYGKHEGHPDPVRAPARSSRSQLGREAREDRWTHLVALFTSAGDGCVVRSSDRLGSNGYPVGIALNQVDRRQCEQLLPQEVALLKSCGNEIRKTDYEALDLARARGVRNTTPTERPFDGRSTFRALKTIARGMWDRLQTAACHLSRRSGL